MKYKVFKGGKAIASVMSVLMWNQFRYPQPVQGRYDVATNKMEKIKWAYRCWVKQIEVAEKGSGLEKHFREQNLSFAPPKGFKETARFSMAAGGDLMAVDAMGYEGTPHLFDEIKDFYFDADVTCANLESCVYDKAPIGRNQVTGMPAKMNTSEGMLDRFIDGGRGIDYFATANNHCYDYEEEGLRATQDILDQKGVWWSGTNRSPEDQEDVLIIEKNGIKVAMLSYTFDMNGNEYEKKWLIDEVRFNDETCDISLIQRHIKKAKEKGADLIVASCHWGWEFEMYPHKNVVEVGHKLIEEGIDVILGAHPHVSQPMEKVTVDRDGIKRDGFIIYSLGDFVSYHPLTKDSKITTVIRYEVVKGEVDGKPFTCIEQLKVLPVYILGEEVKEDEYDCRLVRFGNVVEDSKKAGGYAYGLTEEERKDVPRLEKKILHGILLPANYEGIIAK